MTERDWIIEYYSTITSPHWGRNKWVRSVMNPKDKSMTLESAISQLKGLPIRDRFRIRNVVTEEVIPGAAL